MRACHCIVEGRVQGVGFRYFTLREARRLRLCGWVRNRPRGDVEIHVQGGIESVERFLKHVEIGSPFSEVRRLRIGEAEPADFAEFSIKI